LTSPELGEICNLLAAHPDWHRTRLSRELCQRWDWRTDTGRPKDTACRSLLLKLEARGWIRPPSRQRPSVNDRRNRQPVQIELDRSVLEADLASLQPLRIDLVVPGSRQDTLFRALLQRHHYLGLRNRVGENLGYLVWSRTGRPLAALLFGSAAWHCQPRVLSSAGKSNSAVGIALVETFVEAERFAGTSYRAAGWLPLGRTTGRGRNGPSDSASTTVKEVFVRPLGRHWRQVLCP
jgi:hypothetical protein